jgi:Ca2+-binding RTX toxin-like protein
MSRSSSWRRAGGRADDLLLGGPGNDILGEVGNDILDGGPGADELRGFAGMPGDTGFDLAKYGDRVNPADGHAQDHGAPLTRDAAGGPVTGPTRWPTRRRSATLAQ